MDTLKLVYTVLGSLKTKVKNELVNSDEFVSLLKMGAENASHSNLSMVYGIVQRMGLTRKRLARLVNRGVFSSFLASSDECDSEIGDRAMYRMFSNVARIHDIQELVPIAGLAFKDLTEGSALKVDAIKFMIEASRYARCREAMRKADTLQVCEKLRGDSAVGEYTEKLIEMLESGE